jgi:hypothetical protein
MDHVTIANRAVARIGGIPIQSFDVPGPSGHIVPQTYNAVLDDLLGKYPWHFTKKKAALARLTDPPLIGWTYAFQLPSDRLAPPRAIYNASNDRRPFMDWEPEGDKILTDAEQLWASYQWRPDPNWWPTYFRELVILAVAAELAGALREDWNLRKSLRREVYGEEQYQGEGGQFGVCSALDAQSAPSDVIDGGRNPLTAVRYSPGDARSGFEDW